MPPMRLVSINIGPAVTMDLGSRLVDTGIDKSPVASARVHPLGVAGDTVADEKHHGGPDQAVYVYSGDDYAWWAEHTGETPPPGRFGENLTFDGFGAEPVRIGDRYAVGEVVLEVTAPRIPCVVFAHHVGDPDFIDRFRRARRPGFYSRVVIPGTVHQGDEVTREPGDPDAPTLQDLMDIHYAVATPVDTLRWALKHPVSIRYRDKLESRLARRGG